MKADAALPGARNVIGRRRFLLGGATVAASAFLPVRSAGSAARFSGYPFQLGVASGDPSPDGFVIWTRLVTKPFEPGGGVAPAAVEVDWQVAEDEAMTRVVRRGVVDASAERAHAVHVEVEGLQPDRRYWYRFKAGGEISPTGRARTFPRADAQPERLTFAFASCQKYEVGHFTAYEHMVREDFDLIVFLGDYIYENVDAADAVRPHGLPETLTLDEYRRRYAVYKTDPALQAAHAMAPWIATWDDHEVSNDYAGAVPDNPQPGDPDRFLRRRAAAYRAYYEHMPLRRAARPSGSDLRLYRRLDYCRLARFHVLDTRQYRTDQPAGPRLQPAGGKLEDPSGTILGTEQRQWLFDGLDRSPANWNVIAQQVLMARVDRMPGPEVIVDVDKWAGYEFERRRLLRHIRDAHSMGGLIAQQMALTAPGRVLSLAFLCTFLRGREAARVTPAILLSALRMHVGTRAMRRRAFMQLVMPDAYLRQADLVRLAEELGELFGRDLADQPSIVMKQLSAMSRFDASARMHGLASIPTLVVAAALDRIALPKYGRSLAAAVPGARYVEIPDAGHAVTIQCADRINELLSEHVQNSVRGCRPDA